MTKEQAIKNLKELQKSKEPESAHAMSDDILCSLLHKLDYEEVVEEYNKIKKWYA